MGDKNCKCFKFRSSKKDIKKDTDSQSYRISQSPIEEDPDIGEKLRYLYFMAYGSFSPPNVSSVGHPGIDVVHNWSEKTHYTPPQFNTTFGPDVTQIIDSLALDMDRKDLRLAWHYRAEQRIVDEKVMTEDVEYFDAFNEIGGCTDRTNKFVTPNNELQIKPQITGPCYVPHVSLIHDNVWTAVTPYRLPKPYNNGAPPLERYNNALFDGKSVAGRRIPEPVALHVDPKTFLVPVCLFELDGQPSYTDAYPGVIPVRVSTTHGVFKYDAHMDAYVIDFCIGPVHLDVWKYDVVEGKSINYAMNFPRIIEREFIDFDLIQGYVRSTSTFEEFELRRKKLLADYNRRFCDYMAAKTDFRLKYGNTYVRGDITYDPESGKFQATNIVADVGVHMPCDPLSISAAQAEHLAMYHRELNLTTNTESLNGCEMCR